MNFKSIFLCLAGLSLSIATSCDASQKEETEINNKIVAKQSIVETTTEVETNQEINKETLSQVNQIQAQDSTTREVAYQAKSNIRFICASGYDRREDKKFPTTYAWTPRGKIAIVRWKFPWYESQQWNNQSRCEAVSSRFQEAYDNGSMAYFTYGKQNNQNVICTAYSNGGDCVTMLLTLRTEDDEIAMIRDLTNIMNGKGTTPVPHNNSGEKREYFEIDNINQFLETEPVEKE